MSFTAKINGLSKKFNQIAWEKSYSSNPASMTLTLPRFETHSYGGSISLEYNGSQFIWGTFLEDAPQHSKRSKTEYQMKAEDNLEFLRRKTFEGTEEADPQTLVTNLLSGTGISAGTIDEYGQEIEISKDDQTALELLQRIANIIGWKYKNNLNNTLDFKETIGTDRHSTIVVEVGDNCEVLNKSGGIRDVYNRIRAEGKGLGDDVVILGQFQVGVSFLH